MKQYSEAYAALNEAQKKAVDTIDGPVLVIAGPGTGKTELLSVRIANIMRQTDTAPGNILCLTFTDTAARAMRERLEKIIGQAAYHVNIHTFHSFGVEIINQNPDFFLDRQLLQQVDELGKYEILREIFDNLPHSNPLSVRVGEEYIFLKDAAEIIGWLKQNALSPDAFREIIKSNERIFEEFDKQVSEAFQSLPSPSQREIYVKLHKSLAAATKGTRLYGFPEYTAVCAHELSTAIDAIPENGRYAPTMTAWRNRWCAKNDAGEHVFRDSGAAQRKLKAVAGIYETLVKTMRERGLYDFDDMIMESVQAMETQPSLRANLQERYLYVLVDEFQDTNKAQLRMMQALGDNPVFEGRPNILAVGDDDQAIYAFQGAEVSNIVAFLDAYKQPEVVTLTDNYRSTEHILTAAQSIAQQISDRLPQTTAQKLLKAQKKYDHHKLSHTVLPSELAQYQWVAEQIKKATEQGTEPQSIAVIAPRHRYLERLIPYLVHQSIPVSYERRENILEAPIVHKLLTMVRLIAAIAQNQQDDVDGLLAEVMSYEMWDISSADIIDISTHCYDKHVRWLPTLLKHKQEEIRAIAEWLVGLSRKSATEPLEYVLDELVGITTDGTDSAVDDETTSNKKPKFVSPMREFYFSKKRYDNATDSYLSVLGQLTTLRQHLRQWKPYQTLYARDLVEFAALNKEAKLKIIDTNPHTQSTNAVQVMTAYKAKGLEFEHVFLINAQDEVWGPTSRSRSSKISLPKNLPLSRSGDSDNDKLRLLFVAITRAKAQLTITSYTHSLESKLSAGLSFIGGNVDVGPDTLPGAAPQLVEKQTTSELAEILSTDWAFRYRQVIADKPTLFEPILAKYKLSVTHLNNFLDIVDAGPAYFFTHNLLRFPQALSPAAAYGDSIHITLKWLHSQLKEEHALPNLTDTQTCFSEILARKHLRASDTKRLDTRGRKALALYLKERSNRFHEQDLAERGFNNEGVVVNEAVLSGKIDKLHFISTGEASVIDFKTGKPAAAWSGKDELEKKKLHNYRQQLLFYKLLVEHSASFAKKVKVTRGELEFVEANTQDKLVDNLILAFDEKELARFEALIGVVWQHIQSLSMPDVSGYTKNFKGRLAFEQDLLDGKI